MEVNTELRLSVEYLFCKLITPGICDPMVRVHVLESWPARDPLSETTLRYMGFIVVDSLVSNSLSLECVLKIIITNSFVAVYLLSI